MVGDNVAAAAAAAAAALAVLLGPAVSRDQTNKKVRHKGMHRQATNLFFVAVLDVGKAFRFLGGSDVGAGVARGLEVFAFVVLLLPNTLLIARSAACPLLAVLLFSTFRRLDGGLPPLVVAAPEMPRPTGVAAASAVFRDLLPPPCDFFVFSGFCLLCSWSSASES